MKRMEAKKLAWDEQLAREWGRLRSPSRPSIKEQRFYEKHIRNVLKEDPMARILILGSTPEFRDLILKYKSKPISCDINPQVFKCLRSLMKKQGREEFIHSDWLELKERNKFDLAIGHQVFNMLPFSKHKALARAVAKNLKDNGLFIHSTILRAPRRSRTAILDIFKKYRNLAKQSKQRIPFYTTIQGNLIPICYRTRRYFSTPNEWRAEIEELYQKGLVTEREKSAYFDIMPPSRLRVYLPSKREIERSSRKHFQILSTYCEPTRYYNSCYWPVYILKKK